jgi:hypothetical protein
LSQKLELDLSKVKELAERRVLLTELPPDAKVEILGLGNFIATKANYFVSLEDKILEIRDVIEKLNHRPTSIKICSDIYDEYLKNPTLELKAKLKITYEAIPKHQRRYVGDMDIKDTAVRMIIYGEQEIENWSHYRAAKNLAIELPIINVPKPKDE